MIRSKTRLSQGPCAEPLSFLAITRGSRRVFSGPIALPKQVKNVAQRDANGCLVGMFWSIPQETCKTSRGQNRGATILIGALRIRSHPALEQGFLAFLAELALNLPLALSNNDSKGVHMIRSMLTLLVTGCLFAIPPLEIVRNAKSVDWSQLPTRGIAPQRDKNARVDVLKVVPHLSANDIWKSSLLIRNDATYDIQVFLEFIAPDGLPVDVRFVDSDGSEFVASGFSPVLSGYEIFGLDFDVVSEGFASFQVFAYTSESERFYGLEALYHRYDGNAKVASVGAPYLPAFPRFLLNMDERFDLFSGQQKFRGLALTNTESENCDCIAYLYDDGLDGANLQGYIDAVTIQLGSQQKWVGLIIDLFPDIDDQLAKGFGYIDVDCQGRYVNAMGLAFETNSPLAGSVPIDPLYPADKGGSDNPRSKSSVLR